MDMGIGALFSFGVGRLRMLDLKGLQACWVWITGLDYQESNCLLSGGLTLKERPN